VSKITFSLILFFYSSLAAFAQLEPVRNFSVKEGLPSGVVYDCLEDKQGFMWFATAAGLTRFDGFNFKVFTTEDGLTNNEVLQIALDPDGSIWIFPFGTTACIYDPATQKLYNEQNYPELKKIKNLMPFSPVRNSVLGPLVHSITKTFYLENKKINLIEMKKGKNGDIDIWPLNKDSIIKFNENKSAYLFTKNDSSRLDFIVPAIDINFSKSIDWGKWKIFINSNQTTELTLYEYTSDGTPKLKTLFKSDHLINSVTKYENKIYITTTNGVYTTDTLLTQSAYFFQGKNISKAFVDKNGNEWLCSLSGEGVYLRLKNDVRQLNVSSGLLADNTTSLRLDNNNLLICGDGEGNVYTIDPSQTLAHPTYLTRLPESIRGIELYGNSFIAYSSYKLFAIDRIIPDVIGAIKSVITYNDDNLLIGSHGTLQLYDRNKNKINKIGEGIRYTALAYANKRIYIGNNEGLFEKTVFKVVSDDKREKDIPEILKKPINHMVSTMDGILWIATNNNGIVAYLNNKIIGNYTTLSSQPITSNICKKIFYDNEDRSIWVVTNKGLNKINYTLSGDSLSATIKQITSSEGLNDDDVNDVCVKNGKVYAATIKGICVFNTSLLREEVPIRITDVIIKNNVSKDSSISIKSNYELNYWQNNISISYAGICFTCNNKLVYQYRMLGIGKDTSWQTTTANTVEFGELKKGNYRFQVRTNQENIREISFFINPAFWQTKLFYGILGAVIVGIFFFSIKFIAWSIRKREIEKTTINKNLQNWSSRHYRHK
jgi:ligand-binding sensor domain-containing protein